MRERKAFTWVYVLRDENDLLKIGRSDNPLDRVANIRTGNPYDVILWRVVRCLSDPVRDFDHLEDHLHEQFAGDNVSGEWYAVDLDDLDEYLEKCVEAEDLPGVAVLDAQEQIERAEKLDLNRSEVLP